MSQILTLSIIQRSRMSIPSIANEMLEYRLMTLTRITNRSQAIEEQSTQPPQSQAIEVSDQLIQSRFKLIQSLPDLQFKREQSSTTKKNQSNG